MEQRQLLKIMNSMTILRLLRLSITTGWKLLIIGGGLIVYGSFIYYPNVSNDDEPVAQFVSLHNYPNPFRKSTQISYSLTKQDKVKIQIYNLKGQLVETLLNENKPAGNYTFEWNVDEMSSGIYFMKLLTKEKEIVRKLVIIK